MISVDHCVTKQVTQSKISSFRVYFKLVALALQYYHFIHILKLEQEEYRIGSFFFFFTLKSAEGQWLTL